MPSYATVCRYVKQHGLLRARRNDATAARTSSARDALLRGRARLLPMLEGEPVLRLDLNVATQA